MQIPHDTSLLGSGVVITTVIMIIFRAPVLLRVSAASTPANMDCLRDDRKFLGEVAVKSNDRTVTQL